MLTNGLDYPRVIEISRPHLPPLRILRLSKAIILSLSASPFCQLTVLHLQFYCVRTYLKPKSSSSLEQLLNALEGCCNLTQLYLHKALRLHALVPLSNPPRVIRLEKLSTLVLLDWAAYTSWFLSSIVIAPDLDLEVVGEVHRAFAVGRDIPTLVASLLPSDVHGKISQLRTSTTACVRAPDYVEPFLRISGCMINIQLDVLPSWGILEHDALDGSLTAFRALFAGSPLTSFFVGGTFSFSLQGTKPWVELFTEFPKIEYLEINGVHPTPPLGLLCALGRPPAATQTAEHSTAKGRLMAPVCRNLKEVLVEADMTWEAGVFETIAAVLRRRAAFGLPRLDRFCVQNCLFSLQEEFRHAAGFYRGEICVHAAHVEPGSKVDLDLALALHAHARDLFENFHFEQ